MVDIVVSDWLKVEESIKFTANLVDILKESALTKSDDESPSVPMIRILNARAYYACVLTLSDSTQCRSDGYDEYEEVMKDSTERYGEFDSRTIGFYCYFGLHFVQIGDWKKVHQHIDHILSLNTLQRKLEHFEQRTIYDLLKQYMEHILKMEKGSTTLSALMNGENGSWINGNGWRLHERQLLAANEINGHLMASNHSTQSENDGESTTATDESMGFQVDSKKEDGTKVNVLSMLLLQIRFFMVLDQRENALRIINDILMEQRLNENSTMLAQYLKMVGMEQIESAQIEAIKDLDQEIKEKMASSHSQKTPIPPQQQQEEQQSPQNVVSQQLEGDLHSQSQQ